MGKEEFPALAEVAMRCLCMHSTACARDRNLSAWGLMFSKLQSRLNLECAQKLIYIRCNSRQCSKSAEADLESSLQLLEEDNQEAAQSKRKSFRFNSVV